MEPYYIMSTRTDIQLVNTCATPQWSGRIFTRRDYVSFAKFSMRPLALGHSLYMESSKNVMGHSLHQAFSYETFEIWMSHSLHVSPLNKHCTPTPKTGKILPSLIWKLFNGGLRIAGLKKFRFAFSSWPKIYYPEHYFWMLRSSNPAAGDSKFMEPVNREGTILTIKWQILSVGVSCTSTKLLLKELTSAPFFMAAVPNALSPLP